jgi:hypothetical protein
VNGFGEMSQVVKTKRQANFKDFKRFGALKGVVEQKNVVFKSFVCKLGLFWHSWAFKTLVSLAFKNGPLVEKKAQFTHELIEQTTIIDHLGKNIHIPDLNSVQVAKTHLSFATALLWH